MSLLPLELALKPLRDYQERSYAGLRAAVRSAWRCPVLDMPTGSGKTFLTAHIIANALKRGKRPLFVVPILSLIDKTIQAFEGQGITDIGVIQQQHCRTDHQARVQIASMQTLIKRPQLMRGFDIVIIDECHECYQELYAWMARDTHTVFIGLSATPWAKGMGLHWSGIVKGATIQELLSKGAICPLEIFEAPVQPKRSKIGIVAGEFSDKQATEAMSDKALVADVYDQWVARGSHAKWFVFGQNCNHAKMLKESFERRGVRCGYIDANTPMEERDSDNPLSEAIFCRYRRGDIDVMFSVGCLGTGVDEDVRGISLAYVSRSRIKLKQDVGRGERIAEGKKRCIVNDHGRNFHDLGYPEDWSYDHLDKHDPADKGDAYAGEPEPPKAKHCGKCKMLLPARTRVCPKCGEAPVVCTVETVDGELVKRAKEPKKEKYSMAQKQAWFSQFLGIAQDRGRSKGWAAHRYKEKFGVWPNKLIDIPAMPERAVLDFDKHCRIKFAKGKEAEAKRAKPTVEEYHGAF